MNAITRVVLLALFLVKLCTAMESENSNECICGNCSFSYRSNNEAQCTKGKASGYSNPYPKDSSTSRNPPPDEAWMRETFSVKDRVHNLPIYKDYPSFYGPEAKKNYEFYLKSTFTIDGKKKQQNPAKREPKREPNYSIAYPKKNTQEVAPKQAKKPVIRRMKPSLPFELKRTTRDEHGNKCHRHFPGISAMLNEMEEESPTEEEPTLTEKISDLFSMETVKRAIDKAEHFCMRYGL